VDVLDVQGGSAHLAAVHHAVSPLALHDSGTEVLYLPNLVKIAPEFHCGGVLAKTCEVPSQEHLAALDLWCFFVEIVLFWLCLVGCCACVEGA